MLSSKATLAALLLSFTIQNGLAFAPGTFLPITKVKNQNVLSSPGIVLYSSTSADGFQDSESSSPPPKTFREAEILGLRLMQEGKHEEALKVFQNGLNLPGSRPDIIRTKTLSGPSPVGGSAGGTEGKKIMTLDEFEMQAAHYNIACAHARLGRIAESVANIEKAFNFGFDNYATVRADPDLSYIHGTAEFEDLMEKYDPKKGFFSFFGGKQ